MAFAYGLTTPLGQVIGLATHDLYSPDSETGLLLVGIVNAICAGFLIFTSLINVLQDDFFCEASWRTLRGTRRVVASLLLFAGAFAMALMGAWA